MPTLKDLLPPPPWEGPPLPRKFGKEDVDLFIAVASIRNVLNASMASVREAHGALDRGDIRTAVERFGVGHEQLHETTMLAKQFPAAQAMRVLESPDYRRLLEDIGELEEALVARCERG